MKREKNVRIHLWIEFALYETNEIENSQLSVSLYFFFTILNRAIALKATVHLMPAS